MANDFVITLHALQRFDMRFPDEGPALADLDLGALIHDEVSTAYEAGRYSKVPPLELANRRLSRLMAAKGYGEFVWTPGRRRGYVVLHMRDEIHVLTVLQGDESLSQARKKLFNSQH